MLEVLDSVEEASVELSVVGGSVDGGSVQRGWSHPEQPTGQFLPHGQAKKTFRRCEER